MKRPITAVVAAAVAILAAQPALAAGDAARGEKVFKKCTTCHTIQAGAKAKPTGPNLHGVLGRKAGSTEFKYSDAMVEAGEKGLVWDEANMKEYVEDPKKFLAKFLGAEKVTNKMTFQLKPEGERDDVIEYIKSVSK